MAKVTARVSRQLDAPPERVLEFLRDYHEERPKILTRNAGANVTLEASWDGAGGIGGIFEGLFAPLGLRRIYAQVLDRLAAALTT